MKYNRGGKSLITGDIGRFKILRQFMLRPGEKLSMKISGNVRLAALRQQTSVYLNASIEAFAAPVRWYWDDFPQYIREGVTTAKTIPTVSTGWTDMNIRGRSLGIGSVSAAFARWYVDHPVQIFNEWYRWMEDPRHAISPAVTAFYADYGQPCVNLPFVGSRLHEAPTLDVLEYKVPSASADLDVRELSHRQARFHQAAVQDWTAHERYNVFMQEVFNAKGNNEVDKVPTRLRKGANLSVQPRDMYATDGASLGELASLNNFTVGHSWDDYIAKEHEIIGVIMVLRFMPIMVDNTAPMVYPGETNYSTIQGDEKILSQRKPEPVSTREIESSGDGTVAGYAPAGWQWREGHTHVDYPVKLAGNFPLLDPTVLTADGFRDASRIDSGVFRSSALRHYFGDLDFKCLVQSSIGPAGESIIAGSGPGKKGPSGNHPTGGFLV